jgi:hypothetical protein
MNDFVLAWYNCYPEHPIIFSARLTIVTSIVRAQDNKLVALTEDSETVVSIQKLAGGVVQDVEFVVSRWRVTPDEELVMSYELIDS